MNQTDRRFLYRTSRVSGNHLLQLADNASLRVDELFRRHVDVFFLEVHVALLRDGDEVDVGVRHNNCLISNAS